MDAISKYLRKKFESKKDYISYTIFDVTLDQYIRLTILFTIITFFVTSVSLSILLYILFKHYDAVFFLLSLLFGIVISSGTFLYMYYYPNLAKEDYKKSIEDNLPFFSQYAYALSGSGMNIMDIFRISAKRREFGSLSREIRYLVALVDTFGEDITSAIMKVASRTPSNKFKEFLYGVLSVIRTGGDLREYLKEFSKAKLEEYRIELKIYVDKANTFVTLYGFLFVAFPLVMIILAYMFSITIGSDVVLVSLNFFFLYILPLIYILYIYLIYITQPRL